jgi:glutamyl-tRNA synthetase
VLRSLVAVLGWQGVERDASGGITAVAAELNLAGDVKATKLKLTWLPDVPELVPLKLCDFGYLITKKKVRRFLC